MMMCCTYVLIMTFLFRGERGIGKEYFIYLTVS
jgi:hypothetical protein